VAAGRQWARRRRGGQHLCNELGLALRHHAVVPLRVMNIKAM